MLMATGDPLQDSDLIAHLMRTMTNDDQHCSKDPTTPILIPNRCATYHMLPSLHELLIDNLARIVFPRLDMDRFFHDCIRPTAKRFASTVLHPHQSISGLVQLRTP